MIAASLAYLWMIYLGVEALREGWYKQFHRGDRVDLSLFQLGMRLLEHMLMKHGSCWLPSTCPQTTLTKVSGSKIEQY